MTTSTKATRAQAPIARLKFDLRVAGYDVKTVRATARGLYVRLYGYGKGDDLGVVHRLAVAATSMAPDVQFVGPRFPNGHDAHGTRLTAAFAPRRLGRLTVAKATEVAIGPYRPACVRHSHIGGGHAALWVAARTCARVGTSPGRKSCARRFSRHRYEQVGQPIPVRSKAECFRPRGMRRPHHWQSGSRAIS